MPAWAIADESIPGMSGHSSLILPILQATSSILLLLHVLSVQSSSDLPLQIESGCCVEQQSVLPVP